MTGINENERGQGKLLDFVLLRREELKEVDVARMWVLMDESYDHVNYAVFLKDLLSKDYVGLLLDTNKMIQGFTTFAINPSGTGTEEYAIIFSGDTVISRPYWGTLEMMRGWGISIGKIMLTQPGKDWYWFLLSKGHRTYLYLPLFFNEYYPSIYQPNDPVLKKRLDSTATKMFPDYYRPDSGVIVFQDKMGELKPELAQSTFEKQNKPNVKFFLEKNPKFFEGVELACMTRLHPENIRGYGKKYILEGLQQKHSITDETA